MIAYFSGTGNSCLVARMIGGIVDDETVSIPDLVRGGVRTLHSEKPFVIVCPIYAWRIPRYIEEFVMDTEFTGSSMVYFVVTCGSDPGTCEKYVETLCRNKGMDLMGMSSVVMPDNYIIMFNPPSDEESRKLIKKAVPAVEDIGKAISEGRNISSPHTGSGFKSFMLNPLFYKFIIESKGFYCTDACTGCGNCVRDCQVDCIEMVDGRPVWHDGCIQCLACINRCPASAIEFKGKTIGRNRYVCPYEDPEELMQ